MSVHPQMRIHDQLTQKITNKRETLKPAKTCQNPNASQKCKKQELRKKKDYLDDKSEHMEKNGGELFAGSNKKCHQRLLEVVGVREKETVTVK